MRKRKKDQALNENKDNKKNLIKEVLPSFLISLLILVSLLSIIFFNESTGFFGYSLNVSAGFVTKVTLNATYYDSLYWAGYAGNFYHNSVNMTCNISSLKTQITFNEIKRLNLSFDCFGLTGNDIYISPVWYTELDTLHPIIEATPAEVDAFLGISSTQKESATNVFTKYITILFGPTSITGRGAYTNQEGILGGTDFPITALKDANGQIFFATNVNLIPKVGYDGNYYNYQIIVPVPANRTNMTYYFFGDPITDPYGKCVNRTSILKGKITDPGIPLENAAVYSSGTVAYTNSSGDYQMNVSSGNNTVAASRIGFYPEMGSYEVASGETATFDADLEPWKFIFPEGIYSIEPPTPPIAGNYQYNFSIPFVYVTANMGDIMGCYVEQSNCYDDLLPGCDIIFVNTTFATNVMDLNVTVSYKLKNTDVINSTLGGKTDNWIPWRINKCGIYTSAMYPRAEWYRNWSIHVHPIEWTPGDIANAVNGKKAPNMFMLNEIKTDDSGDVAFAVAKYGGTKVEQECNDKIDNPEESDTLVDCDDPDCFGITYSCLDKQSFANLSEYYSPSGGHGTLAAVIPSGDIGTATTSGTTFNTKVEYTMHSMPNGTLKMRFSRWALSKTATIFIEGLPKIGKVNKYSPGNDSNNGYMKYFLDKNGDPVDSNVLNSSQTYENTIILRSYLSGGTEINNLDTTLNITFANASSINMSQGYTLTLTFNYVEGSNIYQEEMNVVVYFDDKTYNGGLGNRWNSTNELENDIFVKGTTWNVCNDTKNADFDYLNCAGNQQYCFEQSSYDCYDINCNMLSGPSAWNHYLSASTKGLCAYYKENQTAAMCFDRYNNDWATEDINLGDQNTGLYLVDCRDIDCNRKISPSNTTQICHYNIELNCSDGFDNDMYNRQDCQLQAGGGINNAEYDCRGYCRQSTGQVTETGALCDNNKDDDWDKYYTTTGGFSGYSLNNSYGAGMDCAWGIGADENCNMTIMGSGYRCELGRELNCSDEFDNDYDNGQGQPSPGWNAVAYNSYFNVRYNLSYVASADYNDYDCKIASKRPSRESLFASWCFDGIDNDLDAYYLSGGSWLINTSTGIDCADPDCATIVNPDNPNQLCLRKEYDPTSQFFINLNNPDKYCRNGYDDDSDNSLGWPLGGTDCRDPDCNKKFGICFSCPKTENKTWDSCANGMDDDYDMPASMIDCDDPDCLGQQGDYGSHICALSENNLYLCNDGFDNDGDGPIDCADSGCNGIGNCQASESNCNDDIDNDRDGLIDCADLNCNGNILCGGSTDMSGSYILPSTSTVNYGGVIVTWDSIIKKGTNYTVRLQKSTSYNRANLYIGSLTGAGLPVGTGLRAPEYVFTGPNASYFETVSYNQAGSKGQIQIMDQVPGDLKSSFDITLKMPTNNTLTYRGFEYYHSIDGSTSTGNTIGVIILDDTPPTITRVVTEPTNKNALEYGSSVYAKVIATDPNNGGPYEGTIDRCYYNVTGPNGYFDSGYDNADCVFSFGNIIRDGNYTLKTWARDDAGNIGNVNTTIIPIGLKPKYHPASFLITKKFYFSDNLVQISASFYTDDASIVDSCDVFYTGSNGSTIIAGTLNTTITGDKVNCSGLIDPPNSDDMYSFLLQASDLEGDKANSTMQTIYVCDNRTSHGIGSNGNKWDCILRDMSGDGIIGACAIPEFLVPIDNQSWPSGQNNTYILLSEHFFEPHGDSRDLIYNFTPVQNITVIIADNGNVTLIPDPFWTGVTYIVFYAADEEGDATSNNITLAVGNFCGNGARDSWEQCDDANLNSMTCADVGFYSGTLTCNNRCLFNTSMCTSCGNNITNGLEDCDGSDLSGYNCVDLGFASGTLGCDSGCFFDTSMCISCGNNVIDTPEDCDGSNLNGKTCVDEGFVSGTLGCQASCVFDTSGCSLCGNDIINGLEECDGFNLNGKTCVDEGFASGTLGCQASCLFNTSMCIGCGNNVIDGSEECDGSDLDGETCVDQGFVSGTLGCDASCIYDTSSCSLCGNNLIDGSEECDGSSLNGKTCADYGFDSGDIGCSSSCTINSDNCFNQRTEGGGAGNVGGLGGKKIPEKKPPIVEIPGGEISASLDSIKKTLKYGDVETEKITFTNTMPYNVVLNFRLEGDVAKIATLDSDSMTLETGSSKGLKIKFDGNTAPGTYTGSLIIEGDYDKKIPIEIEVTKQKELIPIKIDILPPLMIFSGLLALALLYLVLVMIFDLIEKFDHFFPKIDFKTLPAKGSKTQLLGNISGTNKKVYLDVDSLLKGVLISGGAGIGKSIAAKNMVEGCLEKGVAVAAFDQKGNWKGMLEKPSGKNITKDYKRFGLNPKKDPQAFKGQVIDVKKSHKGVDIIKAMEGGEISVLNASNLDPKDYDNYVADIIKNIMSKRLDDSRKLKYMLVIDDAHSLSSGSGAKGKAFKQIEESFSKLKQKGIGLMIISESESEVLKNVSHDFGTSVHFKTRHAEDLSKIKKDHNHMYAHELFKKDVGTGMFHSSKFNNGKAFYIDFRPPLHNMNPKR